MPVTTQPPGVRSVGGGDTRLVRAVRRFGDGETCADVAVSPADGRLVDDLAVPAAERVLDRMRAVGEG